MNIAKKVIAGISSGFFAAALVIVPLAGSVDAAASKRKTLEGGSNKAMEVQTELDCTQHMLTVKVTNKTTLQMKPSVTFNFGTPNNPSQTIESGESGYYFYYYSGNYVTAHVKVAATAQPAITLHPSLTCSEPISFTISQATSSKVMGVLTNNSTFIKQAAFIQVNGTDVHAVTLLPGKSKLITIPHISTPEIDTLTIAVGTAYGFQSYYSVDVLPMPEFPEPRY